MIWQNIVAWLALFISTLAFANSVIQMRIASSKVKLDLYDKRFEIYQSALELYQAIWTWNIETIAPLERRFIRGFRESQFLFDDNDGIYKTLEKIKDCNALITASERSKEPLLPNDDGILSQYGKPKTTNSILVGKAAEARIEFDTHLLTLERQMTKYLDFRNIDGWTLRRPR